MRKLFTITLLAAYILAANAEEWTLSAYDQNKPIGFGASVTGSSDENPVVVTTYAEFVTAMGSNFNTTKKTIYVKGTIDFNGQKGFYGVKNKTIYGLPGSRLRNLNTDVPTSASDKDAAIEKSGILYFRSCDNIILRNLTFESAGACDFNGNDNLYLWTSTNIWVDHCDFQDGVDGNFDCCLGSDNISVTWCRFRYLKSPRAAGYGGSSSDHRFSCLWGNSDSRASDDQGKLRTTFANCWWDEGCKERMPRVRFGQVHIVNCLYSSTITSYCVGGGYRSNCYIEKCAFTSDKAKKTPWKCYATSGSYTDYNVTLTNCLGTSDRQANSGSIAYFVPSGQYTYDSYDPSLVESVVSNATNGAGATLQLQEGEPFTTSISTPVTLSPTATEYYNLAGQRVSKDTKGILIQNGRKFINK